MGDVIDYKTQGIDEQLEHLSDVYLTGAEQNAICDQQQQQPNGFAEDTELLNISPPLSPYHGNEFDDTFLASISPDDMFYRSGDSTDTASGSSSSINNDCEKSVDTSNASSEQIPGELVVDNDVSGVCEDEEALESGNEASVALTDFFEVEISCGSEPNGVNVGIEEKSGTKRKRGRPKLDLSPEERAVKRRTINKVSAKKSRAKKYAKEEALLEQKELLEKEQKNLREHVALLERDLEMLRPLVRSLLGYDPVMSRQSTEE